MSRWLRRAHTLFEARKKIHFLLISYDNPHYGILAHTICDLCDDNRPAHRNKLQIICIFHQHKIACPKFESRKTRPQNFPLTARTVCLATFDLSGFPSAIAQEATTILRHDRFSVTTVVTPCRRSPQRWWSAYVRCVWWDFHYMDILAGILEPKRRRDVNLYLISCGFPRLFTFPWRRDEQTITAVE